MRSRGKQIVTVRYFTDDVFESEETKQLTVYQQGNEEVVHYISGYRTIRREPYGYLHRAVLEIRMKKLPAQSTRDVLKSIGCALEE